MNTIAPKMSRGTAPYQRRKESPATRELRQEQQKSIMDSPRFRALKRGERNLARQLLWWHDPLTGKLGSRTPTATLAAKLDITERSVALSRKGLITVGLIVGYLPGSGHEASTYVIARTWDEADDAVKLRTDLGEDAPYFPELPDRSVPGLPKPRQADLEDDGEDDGQDGTDDGDPAAPPAPAAEQDPPRRPRRTRPTPPTPGPIPFAELESLAEVEARKAEGERFDEAKARGVGLARAAIGRQRSDSDAA